MVTKLTAAERHRCLDRIRHFEKALAVEFRQHRSYADGAGRRYQLGPLYLLVGDLVNALESFEWFDGEFPDDGGDPLHALCWALTLHRCSRPDRAAAKLRETMLMNPYLVPRLLGEKPRDKPGMWLGTNLATSEYVDSVPVEYFDLWTDEDLAWARSVISEEEFGHVFDRWTDIQVQLGVEPVGPRRSALVSEAFALREAVPVCDRW